MPEIRRQMIERLEAELESIIAAADAALDADERLATAAAAAAAAPSMPEASAAADAAPWGAAAGADAPASAQQLAGTVLRAVRALCAGPEAGAGGPRRRCAPAAARLGEWRCASNRGCPTRGQRAQEGGRRLTNGRADWHACTGADGQRALLPAAGAAAQRGDCIRAGAAATCAS